jgi:hypothetical protein
MLTDPLSAQSSICKAIRLPRFTAEWNDIHLHEFQRFVEIRPSMNQLVECRNSDIETKYGHYMRRQLTNSD